MLRVTGLPSAPSRVCWTKRSFYADMGCVRTNRVCWELNSFVHALQPLGSAPPRRGKQGAAAHDGADLEGDPPGLLRTLGRS